MIIYNVTVKVHSEITLDWQEWMNTTHIKEMMELGLFQKYSFCRLLEQDDSEGFTFVVQYFCANKDAYETYLKCYSEAMRQKGIERYGDKVLAFRTLMEVLG